MQQLAHQIPHTAGMLVDHAVTALWASCHYFCRALEGLFGRVGRQGKVHSISEISGCLSFISLAS